jgi:nicotinamide riboside kinase
MRLAISGCANSGKSTLVKAFLNRWPMYTTPTKTYRDVIKDNNLDHSSNTNDESQLLILDWMMQEQKKYDKNSYVVYDRCPWDNLAYTLQGNALDKISDQTTAATISFVKESMKDLDIIFWLKYNPAIKVVADGLRDANGAYIKQTDQVFQGLFDQYMDNLEEDVFYPKNDCPAIVCIDEHFATIDDRLMFIGEFLDHKGDLIEGESMLSEENLTVLEGLLGDQGREKENEERINKIVKEFKK